MTRQVVSAILVAVLAGGCAGVRKGTDLLTPGLLIGPDAAGGKPATELPPKEAAAACLAAAAELDAGNRVDEAIALYERARRLDPGLDRRVLHRLAVLHDKKAEFTNADAEYEAAIKLAPRDFDLLNDYGYSHYCRGNWAKAEEILTQVVTADPAHKRGWTNLGLTVGLQGRFEEARTCFRRVVPEAEARCNVGFLLAAHGKIDAARTEYREALTLAPNLTVARAALEKLGRSDAAELPGAGVVPIGPAGRAPAPPAPKPAAAKPIEPEPAPIVIDPDAVDPTPEVMRVTPAPVPNGNESGP